MVIKPGVISSSSILRFESSVISYGNQTSDGTVVQKDLFESSVISYGNQTMFLQCLVEMLFESSVISYGNQTLTVLSLT